LNDGIEVPMVSVWVPAISIYFNDPDGDELEFIGILSGKSKSNKEKRVVTYKEWLKIKDE
jgi:lactoylglutathione lyase